jgi:hypothetical protein
MEIMTHLVYEDIFNQVEKGGLTIPLSCLGDEKVIDEIIDELLSELDPIEAISYSSFLNMVVQTCDSDESAGLGKRELAAVGFKKDIGDNKVFFHRDCLVHLISLLIASGKNGTMRITGGNDKRGTEKYYKALLLINSKLNRTVTIVNERYTLLKNYFLRDYPPYYSPKTASTILKNRLQRYWYIYNKLLPNMEPNKAEIIYKGIQALENDSGLKLRGHYQVLAYLLGWFLMLPVHRRGEQNERNSSLGFDYRNVNSFYIRRNNFPATDQLLRLIAYIGRDKDYMHKHFARHRRDVVSGFYKNFQDFFDQPIFKINHDDFCIIDLKFFIESMCSGFLWHIKEKSAIKNIIKEMKGYYGQLLENYFIFLLEQIFGPSKISNVQGSGPDSIIETDDYFIIFEFTTEYYRFSSLYNTSIDPFCEDLHRILFNKGKDDPFSRSKKDKGKFLKLSDYINATEKKGKTIIPVLVTENYLGDYDLLNQFNNVLDINIEKNGLTNLQEHKPLIICLDDFEIFWAFSNEGDAIDAFIELIKTWRTTDKGKFMFNFSYFISSQSNEISGNENYKNFFDYSKFSSEIA